MEHLLEILNRSCPKIDFENSSGLISNKILDSVDLITLITDLEEAYDIEIDMDIIDEEHFDSVSSILATIESLR